MEYEQMIFAESGSCIGSFMMIVDEAEPPADHFEIGRDHPSPPRQEEAA